MFRYFGTNKKVNVKDKYVIKKEPDEVIFLYTLDVDLECKSSRELDNILALLKEKGLIKKLSYLGESYPFSRCVRYKYKCTAKTDKLLRARIIELGYRIV